LARRACALVLVALASKNAILIVEFAKQAQEEGASVEDAAVRAARTRLRPILMTSLAFILGVVPLAIATGAGAEMRQSLGTAVFFGMLGGTVFGLLFTPTFYTVVPLYRERITYNDQTVWLPHNFRMTTSARSGQSANQ
jgi:HAE1 family hydrophobic/amphiphilic exporter-1